MEYNSPDGLAYKMRDYLSFFGLSQDEYQLFYEKLENQKKKNKIENASEKKPVVNKISRRRKYAEEYRKRWGGI